MLAGALVDALVAATHERQPRLAGQLADEHIVELPPEGRQESYPSWPSAIAVGGGKRRVHDIDSQDHSGPAAVRGVVDLAAAQRRRVPVVEEPDLGPTVDRVPDVALAEEPIEPLGEQREDVNPQ